MNIAILGQGTIGSGVLELAQKSEDICVKRVLEKRFKTELTCGTIEEIVSDPEIELVSETMGGLHPAYEFAEAVLQSGKHFVTANKLLVCEKGPELQALAEEKGVAFLYSAACGGGIPYLSNMKQAACVDRLTALGGILNGTTNYILDAMTTGGSEYDDALKKAQELGYAERDPSGDVDGLDTMRKLVLACGVGFGARIEPEDVAVCGISAVSARDIAFARAHGYVIRLCATAQRWSEVTAAWVEPCFKAVDSPEASVRKNLNRAWYKGEAMGELSFGGQGAGKLPTAANVLRDIRSVMAGERSMLNVPLTSVKPDNNWATHAYYLRTPLKAEVPNMWVAISEADEQYRYTITEPVSVKEMHRLYKKEPDSFFAALDEQ